MSVMSVDVVRHGVSPTRSAEDQTALLMARFTYKENFHFSVHIYEGDTRIRCDMTVKNSGGNHEVRSVVSIWMVPPWLDEHKFFMWLQDRIHAVEIHEANEWFKVDGKSWFDPHINNRDAGL